MRLRVESFERGVPGDLQRQRVIVDARQHEFPARRLVHAARETPRVRERVVEIGPRPPDRVAKRSRDAALNLLDRKSVV